MIGNVPFGAVALYDPVHNPGKAHTIHNHFLIKALHLTAPGGYVVAISSHYTLDATNPGARAAMYELADLVGAVRLPTGAHQATAGTQALTDILILRRRPDGQPRGDDTWLGTEHFCDGAHEDQPLNRYLHDHPDHVLGELSIRTGMYNAHTLTVTPHPDTDTATTRRRALDQIGTCQGVWDI